MNAALISSGAYVVTAIIALYNLYINKLIFVVEFSFAKIKDNFIDGWHLFITTASSSLYTSSVPVILGVMSGSKHVAYYAVALVVKNISLKMITPVYQAIYPRVALIVKDDVISAMIIIRKYFLYCVFIGIMMSSCIVFFAKWIVLILAGEQYLDSILVLQLLGGVIFISIVNNFLGIQTLVPLGFKSILSKIVLRSGIFSLFSLIPLVYFFDSVGAALSVLITELVICLNLIIFHKNNNIKLLGRNR
jgi:O-antigen/teichoic acid export membrane protein